MRLYNCKVELFLVKSWRRGAVLIIGVSSSPEFHQRRRGSRVAIAEILRKFVRKISVGSWTKGIECIEHSWISTERS